MTERITMRMIIEMVKLNRAEGADVRIPFPNDRPLTILFYEAYQNPNPKICSFKTLKQAYNLLEDMWRKSQCLNDSMPGVEE